MGGVTHAKQLETDEIYVLRSSVNFHAVGYVCSKCHKPVFPLGSTLPDEMLTKEELEYLREKECK